MASQILQQVEAAAAQVVARPLPEVIAQLQGIADNAPDSPIPHLVMAIVSGFAHHDLAESKAYLETAGQRLEQGAGETGDVEGVFSRNLYAVIRNEMLLSERRPARLSGARLEVNDRAQMLQAANDSREAITQLGALASKLKESDLVRTIYPAILAHAQSLGTKTAEYRRGMSSLQTMAKGQLAVADLAGLFLMYGYRRTRNYDRAIEVGRMLAQRNPRSVLPKIMLGNVFYFAGKPDEAAAQFKSAVALAPNDAHPQLAYAQLLERTGRLTEAQEMLHRASQLDRVGALRPFIETAQNLVQTRLVAGPNR